MGSFTADGVARLRRHSGLEHLLPHPGNSHPQAANVRPPHPHEKALGGEREGEPRQAQETLAPWPGVRPLSRVPSA